MQFLRAVFVLFCCVPVLNGAESRPNILIIMVDDMGYSDIGCYGGEIRTPTLDALAANGVRLARFFNCAQCCPSRASLMSGLTPHQAGMGDMNEQGAENEFWRRIGSPAYLGFKTRGIVTLPEALQAAGYQTFMAGKWHLGRSPVNWPNARGFDHSFALIGGACEHFTGYRSWQQKGPISLFVQDGKKVDQLPPNFYTTDTFTDHLLKFVADTDRSKPWFGYLAFTAPHWPIQAHAADIEKYADTYKDGPKAIRECRFKRLKELGLVPKDAKLPELDQTVTEEAQQAKKETRDRWMRTYAAMVDRVDQNIARIVDQLRKTDQFDNTLILFLSDNGSDTVRGPLWGQVSNTPFRKFKVWVHDGGIASPLIAHWPKGIPKNRQGQIVGDSAHIMDIFPTCLDAAGAKHPKKFNDFEVLPLEGVSLLPVMRDSKAIPEERVLCWERMGNAAVRQGNWKLVRGYGPAAADGDIASSGPGSGEWELYRVDTDPGETNNIAMQEPARAKSMAQLYETWVKRVGVVPREQIVEQIQPVKK